MDVELSGWCVLFACLVKVDEDCVDFGFSLCTKSVKLKRHVISSTGSCSQHASNIFIMFPDWLWLLIILAVVLVALLIIVVKVIRRKRAEGESSGKSVSNQMLQHNWIFFVEAEVNSLFCLFREQHTDGGRCCEYNILHRCTADVTQVFLLVPWLHLCEVKCKMLFDQSVFIQGLTSNPAVTQSAAETSQGTVRSHAAVLMVWDCVIKIKKREVR